MRARGTPGRARCRQPPGTCTTMRMPSLAAPPPPPQIEPVYSHAHISGNITGNVTAGGTMFAASANSTCATAPCTYSWDLTCDIGGTNTSLATSAAASVVWTSGAGAGFTVDTTSMSSAMACTVTLLLTDGGASVSNETLRFQVRAFYAGSRARSRPPARDARKLEHALPPHMRMHACTPTPPHLWDKHGAPFKSSPPRHTHTHTHTDCTASAWCTHLFVTPPPSHAHTNMHKHTHTHTHTHTHIHRYVRVCLHRLRPRRRRALRGRLWASPLPLWRRSVRTMCAHRTRCVPLTPARAGHPSPLAAYRLHAPARHALLSHAARMRVPHAPMVNCPAPCAAPLPLRTISRASPRATTIRRCRSL